MYTPSARSASITRLPRKRRLVPAATALLLAGIGIGVASPASAEYTVAAVTTSGCAAGVLAGGFPYDVSTSHVSLRRTDTTITTTCVFSGLPQEYYNADYDFTWTRVQARTDVNLTACLLDDGTEDGLYGEGVSTFTAGGAARVVCTFPVPSA